MKKFLRRRIGMVDNLSNAIPSLHDCIEAVLSQADTLIGEVLEGLVDAAAKTKSKGAYGDELQVSKAAVDFLGIQATAMKKTFKSGCASVSLTMPHRKPKSRYFVSLICSCLIASKLMPALNLRWPSKRFYAVSMMCCPH